MNNRDLETMLARSQTTARKTFLQLPAENQLTVIWEIFRLHTRVIFSHKFVWFLFGVLAYFVANYIINYNQSMINRYDQGVIFNALLQFPLTALAVYLNMQVITAEKENRSLEVMFTVAGSRYKVWLLRLGTLNTVLLLLALAMGILAFFTFADIPIVWAALNGFIPAFFFGNLTLFLSVRFRSGFAAGMLSAGLVVTLLMFSELYYETRYYVFFDPFRVPRRIDPETWNLWLWQNRIGVFLLGAYLLFLGLRGMETRERLLR